jgi:hypothetical protein
VPSLDFPISLCVDGASPGLRPEDDTTLAIYSALPRYSGHDGDYSVFAEAHIGVLPIDDLVTRVYFHFVDARRYVENLWMIADHG